MGNRIKLTLSVDRQTAEKAKRLAQARHTSVSAMFAHYVAELEEPASDQKFELGPLTRKALGIARLPKGKSAKQVLEDALREKYGIK